MQERGEEGGKIQSRSKRMRGREREDGDPQHFALWLIPVDIGGSYNSGSQNYCPP